MSTTKHVMSPVLGWAALGDIVRDLMHEFPNLPERVVEDVVEVHVHEFDPIAPANIPALQIEQEARTDLRFICQGS